MIYAAWFDLHNDDTVVAHPTALRVYSVLVRDPFAFMYARPVKGWLLADQLKTHRDTVHAALNLLIERGYVFEHGRGQNNVRMLSLAIDRGVPHKLEPTREERAAEKELRRVNVARTAHANRRARKAEAEGKHTKDDVRAMYDAQDGLCFYCSESLDHVYHVDHKTPLSRGGSNWPANLCCACVPCNLRKNSLTAEEYFLKLGTIPPKQDAIKSA